MESSKVRLREIPHSKHFFLRSNLTEQLSAEVRDGTRQVPQNELIACALLEVAAEKGHGFFHHFPKRKTWGGHTTDDPEMAPQSRCVQTKPGYYLPTLCFTEYTANHKCSADYPDIVYEPHQWSSEGQTRFYASSHRFRYLSAHGLINPPSRESPRYGIQCITNSEDLLYDTTVPSLVIIALQCDPSSRRGRLFCATTDQLRHEGIFGKTPTRPRPGSSTPDVQQVIKTQTLLRQICRGDPVPKQLVAYELNHCALLYNRIIDWTRNGQVKPSFPDADRIAALVPRPTTPEGGIALGAQIKYERKRKRESSPSAMKGKKRTMSRSNSSEEYDPSSSGELDRTDEMHA